MTLALISRGSAEAKRSKASEHGIAQVLLQQDREIATAYQAYGTPSAVLIRPDGTIGSTLAQGAEAIRALVAQTVGLPVLHSLPSTAPCNGYLEYPFEKMTISSFAAISILAEWNWMKEEAREFFSLFQRNSLNSTRRTLASLLHTLREAMGEMC